MISRSGSQRTAGNRPYSSNNPFRNASTDSSVNQYSKDRQFQEWVKANGVGSPYAKESRATSSSSFGNSIDEEEEHSNNSTVPREPLGAVGVRYV